MEEKIFYELDGIKVTNSRFVVDQATYPISNISSVKTSFRKPSKVFRTFAVILIIFGIFCLFAAITGPQGAQMGSIIFGLLCLAFGISRFKKAKAEHMVVLATSGGEMQAYRTHKQEVIIAIVDALNDAIVHRG